MKASYLSGPNEATKVESLTLRRRPSMIFCLKLALTAVVLCLLVGQLSLRHLVSVVCSARGTLLFAAAWPTVALVLIKPLRWRWLLRAVLPGITYGVALRSMLVAAGARLLLPSKAGEFARVLEVPGLPVTTGVGLTALDLLMDVVGGCLVAVPGAYLLWGRPGAAVLTALAAASGALLLRPRAFLGLAGRLPGLGGMSNRLEGARQVFDALGPGVLWGGLALGLGLNGLRFGQLYLLLGALQTWCGLDTIVLFPVVQLADGFPLTVGGIGVREWLALHVLRGPGLTAESVVAAIVLQNVISNLLPGVPGWWLFFAGRSWEQVRGGRAGTRARDRT